MRLRTRILAALLALVAAAGLAQAQSGHAHGTCDGALACELGAYPDDRYYDADAAAAADEAAASLDADASHADAAGDGSLWAWLSVGWSAFVAKLGDAVALLGVDAPGADGGVDAYVSADGVDVDARVGDLDLDGSPAGDVDGLTWDRAVEASASAEASANAAIGG